MRKTLQDIALILGAKVNGDATVVIESLGGIDEAGPGSLTFVGDPKYADLIAKSRASAILISDSIKVEPSLPYIRVKDADLAIITLAERVADEMPSPRKARHPTAIVGRGCIMGRNLSLGPYVIVEDGAVLEDDVVLYPHVVIGPTARIGKGSVLHSFCFVGTECTVGAGAILHEGVVIGADGFGFKKTGGRHRKVPQIGRVEIGSGVEIGANSTVDRARFGPTVIGDGTKMDDQVHIAHGVRIGTNCLLMAGAVIGGSTRIGNDAIIGGLVGVADHINIGDGAVISPNSLIVRDVEPHSESMGNPSRDRQRYLKEQAALGRLPEMLQQLRDLDKRTGGS